MTTSSLSESQVRVNLLHRLADAEKLLTSQVSQLRTLRCDILAAVAKGVSAQAVSNGGIIPLAQVEKAIILPAINDCKGDKLMASARLGIGKTTIYRKIKHYAEDLLTQKVGDST